MTSRCFRFVEHARVSLSLQLKNVAIGAKLAALIVGSALCLGAALGVSNYIQSSRTQMEAATNTLVAVAEGRRKAMGDYLDSIEQDIRSISENPAVRSAVVDFADAWTLLPTNPTKTLQSLYIGNNPHPTGEKHKLDGADDSSLYTRHHRAYHPWFRKFLEERGYYDIFLFDLNGNLVYTVFKELDYATNLLTGEWKDSDLGNAFRAARDAEAAGQIAFYDFRPYAPSHGAPASFISTPIMDAANRKIGVLVFQMPIDRLNNVMRVRAGMGDSGEAYVVGPDSLMRTDSRFSESSTILKNKVVGPTVSAALEGKTGHQIVTDYRGVAVV
jgi:methyl-accepting chemotaxis protein